MLRAAALRVEVFVDVGDDGTVYADALLLRTDNQRLIGTGHARCVPGERGAATAEEVAVHALRDLTGSLAIRSCRPVSSASDDDRGPEGADAQ